MVLLPPLAVFDNVVLECALHCQVRDVVGMFVGMFDARKMKTTKTMNDGDDACVCVYVCDSVCAYVCDTVCVFSCM